MHKKRKGFAAIIILLLVLYIRLSANTTEYAYKTVYVEAGQTLWGIAERYNNTDLEIRDYIEVVCEHNGIDANIRPGQAIDVPVR